MICGKILAHGLVRTGGLVLLSWLILHDLAWRRARMGVNGLPFAEITARWLTDRPMIFRVGII